MSYNIEEFLIKLDKKNAERHSEIIQKVFEILQNKQQIEEMKMKVNQQIMDQINTMEAKIKSLEIKNEFMVEKYKSIEEKNKSMEEKYKLIEEKNKSMEEKYKLIEEKNESTENQMKNLINENEELKKQIQTKCEETETVAISRKQIYDIWDAIQKGSLLGVKYYYKDNPQNIKIMRSGIHLSESSTPLHYASKLGHLHIMEFIISKEASLMDKKDSKGFTPLMRAVESYKLDAVKLLIEKGANKKGALHLASKLDDLEFIKYLLSKGAKIDEIDSQGFTPLMRAVEGNNFDIVKFLIEKGADTMCALNPASKNGYLNIIEYLLSKGAKIDEIDSQGFSPLMRAVEGNKLNIVKFLIDKGANTMIKNKFNQTPLDLAKSDQYFDYPARCTRDSIVKLLS